MVISEPYFLKKVDILSDLASNILPEETIYTGRIIEQLRVGSECAALAERHAVIPDS